MNEQTNNDSEFEMVLGDKGYQFLHKETRIPFTHYLWDAMKTIEWRAAATVYDKYKKQYDFPHVVLNLLKMFNFKFTTSRKELGKDTNLDFLTQECVKEAKKIGELLKRERQSKEE